MGGKYSKSSTQYVKKVCKMLHEGRLPREVMLLEDPSLKGRLYELCLIVKDVVGVEAKVARTLAKNMINIKAGVNFKIDDAGIAIRTTFLDFTAATCTPSELEAQLHKIRQIIDMKIVKPEPAPIESIHFPINSRYERAVLLRVAVLTDFWSRLEEFLSPSGAECLIYHAARESGKSLCDWLKAYYSPADVTELVTVVAQFVRASGLGIMAVREFLPQEGSVTLTVEDGFEVRKGRVMRTCYFMRGLLTGIFCRVLNREVALREVRCASTGPNYCEFQSTALT